MFIKKLNLFLLRIIYYIKSISYKKYMNKMEIEIHTTFIRGNPNDDGEFLTEIIVDKDYRLMCQKVWEYLQENYFHEGYILDVIEYYVKQTFDDKYINKVMSLFETYFEQSKIPTDIETIEELILYFCAHNENVEIIYKSSEIEVNVGCYLK